MAWGFRRTIAFAPRIVEQSLEIRQWTERPDLPVVHTLLRYPSVELHLRTVAHTDIEGRRFDIVAWKITVDERRDELLAQLLVAPLERSTFFSGPTDAPSQMIFAVPDDLAQIRSMNPESLLAGSLFEHAAARFAGPLAFVSIPQPLEPVPSPGFDPYPSLATAAVRLAGGAERARRHRGAARPRSARRYRRRLGRGGVRGESVPFGPGWSCCACRFKSRTPASWRCWRRAHGTSCRRASWSMAPTSSGSARPSSAGCGWSTVTSCWKPPSIWDCQDAAASGVEALLRRTRADGAITEMPFHIKETAIALATLVRQAELSGDDRTLIDNWPRVVSAVDYLESLRAEAYALPPDDPGPWTPSSGVS